MMRVVGSPSSGSTGPDFQSGTAKEGQITREFLVGARSRGLRSRVWFWALDRIERGLVDLTIRWVDKVRSRRMTTTLLRILEKLEQALETGMNRVLGRGRVLAGRISVLAVSWGNEVAVSWRFDTEFHRTLGLGLLQ